MKEKGIISLDPKNKMTKKDLSIFKQLGDGTEDVMELQDNNGQLLFRKNSFKRLLKNDSLKYFDNGM